MTDQLDELIEKQYESLQQKVYFLQGSLSQSIHSTQQNIKAMVRDYINRNFQKEKEAQMKFGEQQQFQKDSPDNQAERLDLQTSSMKKKVRETLSSIEKKLNIGTQEIYLKKIGEKDRDIRALKLLILVMLVVFFMITIGQFKSNESPQAAYPKLCQSFP